MTKIKELWTPFRWHCVNCGNIVIGYKNDQDQVKVECSCCRTVMVRIQKTKKRDTIEVFAPKQISYVG